MLLTRGVLYFAPLKQSKIVSTKLTPVGAYVTRRTLASLAAEYDAAVEITASVVNQVLGRQAPITLRTVRLPARNVVAPLPATLLTGGATNQSTASLGSSAQLSLAPVGESSLRYLGSAVQLIGRDVRVRLTGRNEKYGREKGQSSAPGGGTAQSVRGALRVKGSTVPMSTLDVVGDAAGVVWRKVKVFHSWLHLPESTGVVIKEDPYEASQKHVAFSQYTEKDIHLLATRTDTSLYFRRARLSHRSFFCLCRA